VNLSGALVNLLAVTHVMEKDPPALNIQFVKDTVIADAQPKLRTSSKPVMWKRP